MPKKNGDNSYHDVFGVKLRRVTSILDRLKHYGLDTWQATCAVDFVMSELVLPVTKGWMSLEQLRETDLERIRKSAMDESRRKRDASATFGKRVHRIIHDYYKAGQSRDLLQRVSKLEPELEPALKGFVDWEDDFKVEGLHFERPVFSFSKKYSGTLDLQAKLTLLSEDYEDGPRRIYVVDFKTGSPDPTHVIQLAAYVVAVEEMDRIKLDGGGLVYLEPETGRPRWKGYERRELLLPFILFEKIKSFVETEDDWKKKEGPPEEPATYTSFIPDKPLSGENGPGGPSDI